MKSFVFNGERLETVCNQLIRLRCDCKTCVHCMGWKENRPGFCEKEDIFIAANGECMFMNNKEE